MQLTCLTDIHKLDGVWFTSFFMKGKIYSAKASHTEDFVRNIIIQNSAVVKIFT